MIILSILVGLAFGMFVEWRRGKMGGPRSEDRGEL